MSHPFPAQAEDIDWSLSLFEKLPEDQRDYVKEILTLPEKMIGGLPEATQETIESFRQMYREQKDIKKRGPKAAVDAAMRDRKPKTPEEEAAEAEKLRMKPLVQMHEEIEKMKSWPSFRESSDAWAALEASRLGAVRDAERESERRRGDAVDEAMRHVVSASDKGAAKATKRVTKANK